MFNSLPEKFRKKIIVTDSCWLWKAYIHKEGYGHFMIKKPFAHPVSYTPVGAHRFSWEHHYGEIPKGLLVCHKCDVRHCVNPEHLFLGTISDNMQDMIKKGRSNYIKGFRLKKEGQRTHPNIKLSDAQVDEIRKTHCSKAGKKSEFSTSNLARKYGVSTSQIYRIANNTRRIVQGAI